jgi:hypothetical protein
MRSSSIVTAGRRRPAIFQVAKGPRTGSEQFGQLGRDHGPVKETIREFEGEKTVCHLYISQMGDGGGSNLDLYCDQNTTPGEHTHVFFSLKRFQSAPNLTQVQVRLPSAKTSGQLWPANHPRIVPLLPPSRDPGCFLGCRDRFGSTGPAK